MKRLLGVGLMGVLGLGGCDSGSDGDGSGSGGSTSESSDTNQTTNDTQTTAMPTTDGTTTSDSGTTTDASSSTDAQTTTDGTTTSDSDSDSDTDSSSSTGEQGGVVPCQPEMSRAQIDAWSNHPENHMPTFGEIARPLRDMRVAPEMLDDLSGDLDPQGGGMFIPIPDGGGVGVECDIWAQDCAKGEKCAAWANDGGGSWNATRCVPVDDAPVGVGETCVAEGGGTSGVDNCDATSMCWDVDADTGEGTCVALCDGTPESPTCEPEATACSIANEGVIILCLPICNPLADECEEGQGCFPVGEFFQCAPVADGAAPGEECAFLNACEDGACVDAKVVPGCTGGACCTGYCDLDGDGSECLAGQECVPWYDMGDEPDACLEGIGICSTGA